MCLTLFCLCFLRTLGVGHWTSNSSRQVYEKLVVDHTVPIEYEAFTKMLGKLHSTTAADTCVLIAFRDDCLTWLGILG
jgi:hypothetical protein